MNIKNILSKAQVMYQQKKFSESSELCIKILNKKPKLINALQILALSYQGLNNIKKAEFEFNKALALDPLNANVLNNFGQLYNSILAFKQAKPYFIKAIKIDNDFGEAYNNLGICYQQLGEFGLAEFNFKKSILHEGTRAEYYQNIGLLYLDLGQFEASMDNLMKSLELNPTQGIIYYKISTLMMYMHRYQDALEVIDLGIASNRLSEIELCELLVAKATLFWLFDNIAEAAQAIQLSQAVYTEQSNYSNIINLRVFHRYLHQLINYKHKNLNLYSQPASKEIYFISESHGFSPNGITVEENSEQYVINSLFIKGAKVFHFTNSQHNKYKESLIRIFSGLNPGSKVILGFGEIDCRNNEGIFKHHLKTQKCYKNIVEEMIQAYLLFLSDVNKQRQNQLYIYGVPAPHPQRVGALTNNEQTEYIDIVAYFNQMLKAECVKYNFSFLDVYSLTNNKGISNMKYNIDDIHLIPPTITKLF